MSLVEIALDVYDSMKGIEKRDNQRDMIAFMSECVENGENGALEAPTGTGKTIAVLVTAYSAWKHLGYKSVISTNTHVLQSQLAERDIFYFKRSLPEKADFMSRSVMGRRRYVCKKKRNELRNLIIEKGPLILPGDKETTIIDSITLAQYAEDDDMTGKKKWIDSSGLKEEDPLALVLSCENCIKRACPYYGKHCAYYRAILFESDLTVANHSLIKTFMENGNSESTLGIMQADLYFFDEAHHLMGYSTSYKFSRFLQRPVRVIYSPIPEYYKNLSKKRNIFAKRLAYLFDKFFFFLSEYSYGMAIAVLREMKRLLSSRYEDINKINDSDVATLLKEELYMVADSYNTSRLIYNDAVSGKDVIVTPEICGTRDLPKEPKSFTDDLKTVNKNLKSCLFLSSTITVDNDYSPFRIGTGADFREGPVIPSTLPWDRTILWIPRALPSPRKNERTFSKLFTSFCFKYVPPFVERDLGGVLILCTSLKRMKLCANALKTVLGNDVLLVQGELPKREILNKFSSVHSPVLVSSNSFREGFDAPGKKLTWIIMDRLPFGPMENEETETTIKLLKGWRMLNDPFKHRLEMMKLSLRQGIGRLIRSHSDFGAVTIFDSRVLTNEKWNTNSAIPIPEENLITDFYTPERWIDLFQRRLMMF
jgi:ATP-dependent DNA helicase DinG